MESDDKVIAICATGFFGMLAACIVGWPAVASSAIGIVAIATAKGENP